MNISFNPTKISSDIEQANAAGENWYETGGTWNYRKQIIIDHTKVAGDLTNFPVLISFTDTKLKDIANGGHTAQSNGNDLLFTSSDGSIKLSHEIETYTNTTGELIAWVKVPNLSSTTDTVLYLYYGNDTATNQQDPTNVWDSNYVMVQHMKDATTSSISDSTSYNNDGTKKAANESLEVNGQIGKGQSFDGTDDYIEVADSDSLDVTTQVTLSTWVYMANNDNTTRTFIDKNDYRINIGSYNQISFNLVNPSGASFGMSLNAISAGSWAYLVCEYNNTSSSMSCYMNGQFLGGSDYSLTVRTSVSNLFLGSRSNLSSYMNGKMDEIRISNTVRSDAWITTEYNNQVSSRDFILIKGEEPANNTSLSSWKYRKAITIDHTKVQADQTDFPILINLSQDADIISHAKTDGSDIVFSSSDTNWEAADSTDLLPYEIEKYDNSTGQLIAWVNISNLSSTTDTVIYMYYGNSTLIEDLQDSPGDTWLNDKGIYHLSNSDTTHSLDSTLRNNNVTKKAADEPSQASGKINQSQSFDGTDDYLLANDSAYSHISSEMTLEAWIKPSLSAWTKKKPIVVTGEDEIVNMQIDYTEGMQSDFDDLRFVDENGTLFRYKISSYTTSTSADIILEFLSIPSSEVVYMYYGNPAASNVSVGSLIVPEMTGWEGRSNFSAIYFNDKMWVLGGLYYDENNVSYRANDLWSSLDGHTWTEETSAAAWSGRLYHESVVFNDKLWVLGGYNTNGYLSDVWSSSDGINWTQETSAAAWSKLYRSQVVVFNNKMWVLGGYDGSYLNSVWSSSDGINWTQETSANWPARRAHQALVFNNKIWVMGGRSSSGYLNDVWSSSDGINWTQETAAASWSTRYEHQALVHGNKMWVLGGGSSANLNDVWSSSDGINWTQETAAAAWPTRYSHQAIVCNNKMWVMGGSYLHDVWSSSDGINWNHDSAPVSTSTFSDAQDVSGAPGTILGKGTNYNLTVNDNLSLNEWTHIALTNDGTIQKYYINGSLSSSQTKSIPATDTNLLKIGDGFYSFPFSGSIDEVHISNSAYSASYIKTQYNNESNPSTFYTLSKQQTYGVNDPTQVQYLPTTNSIEITWESSGNDNTTEYHIENTTTGANSNWQTGLSYKFSELPCNADFTFTLKARKNGLETLPDTYNFDTAYCGVSFVAAKPKPTPSEQEESKEEDSTSDDTENIDNATNPQPPANPNKDTTSSNPPVVSQPTITLPPITQTVSQGTSGSTVQTLQNNLKTLGYFPTDIEANGNFGPTTLQAVKDFQKAHGINPTGFVGPVTLKALNEQNIVSNANYQFNQDLKYNDRNEDVKQLQTNLKERAFFPSSTPSTGWFGPITQKAVNLFKKVFNLIPNGIVDEPMRKTLNGI